MSEILLAVLLGIAAGAITGLVPGLHVNTTLAVLAVVTHSTDTGTSLALGVVALTITHSFVSFIPSTLLGIPAEDKALSILPGHHFAKKGLALHAIRLAIIGGFFALIASVATVPVLAKLLEQTFDYFLPITPFALSAILAFMVLREKELEKKLATVLVIILSAISGIVLLNNSLFSNNLFVLVTGFFTIPSLLVSLSQKNSIPRQSYKPRKINLQNAANSGFLSSIAACFTVFLPAIGPNEAILASSQLGKKPTKTQYLLLSSGVTTANYAISFAALFTIGKTRTGAAVFVKEALALTSENLLLAMATIITAGAIAGLITEPLAKIMVEKFEKTNYQQLTRITLAFILLLVLFLSGPVGFIAIAVASSIGVIALLSKVNRSTCMAFLIVPAILFYVTH